MQKSDQIETAKHKIEQREKLLEAEIIKSQQVVVKSQRNIDMLNVQQQSTINEMELAKIAKRMNEAKEEIAKEKEYLDELKEELENDKETLKAKEVELNENKNSQSDVMLKIDKDMQNYEKLKYD